MAEDSSDDEAIALISLCLAQRKREHRFWVRSFLQKRDQHSTYVLVRELALGDREMYFRYMRMTPNRFEHLLRLVAPAITKMVTNYREPIPPDVRLALTLRHLATGESHISLSLQFRVGRQTISNIIPETCQAIFSALSETYLKPPETPAEWLKIADEFQATWNLPHVIGALDGKHVRIRCPHNSGTLYHNYKGFFSLVLLACCDAKYCFTLFDIGQYGSNNDSGVLLNSDMGKRFAANLMNLPEPDTLPGCAYDPLPYFLVGDEIFPLKEWLMRPYPGSGLTLERSIYNYRHCRSRRPIENTFGVWAARWLIFHKAILGSVENIEKIVMATMALHNYLRMTDNASYCPQGYVDSESSDGTIIPGFWRSESDSAGIADIPLIRGSRYRDEPLAMRDALQTYVNSEEGSLSWQLERVTRI